MLEMRDLKEQCGVPDERPIDVDLSVCYVALSAV